MACTKKQRRKKKVLTMATHYVNDLNEMGRITEISIHPCMYFYMMARSS